MARWGLVATIKAPPRDILNFAAHHIDLGAHRLYLYLDEPCAAAYPFLKAHAKVRVTNCDAAHWKRLGGRAQKHQVRQTRNATHAYSKSPEVDWLCHIDADEFLLPDSDLSRTLEGLPGHVQTARIRALEALAPESGRPAAFKSMPLDRKARRAATDRLYPDYAAHIDDGFLSHIAGKLFVRTGLPEPEFRIHNFYTEQRENPGQIEFDGTRLLHLHGATWESWRAAFDYRHEKGAYRAELDRVGPSGQTLHQFFALLYQSEGEAGLRQFYNSVQRATPSHMAALEREGLLFRHDLDLDRKRLQHFPDSDGIVS